ncbi:LysR family transcriptional regulator [Kitasatospora sp. McL0602]|uniref:LysR family transcriptional regulator n=1 Tax=Kitasatospora sp. McL0602 TaxID=3439530 RepID=UPI003F8A71C4
MIERHELETLLTLAEELHFGRTAERLHVSTARISQTVRKLERRVGTPLFHRTSRRVELTPVGRQLVTEIRPAWASVGAALQRATEAGRGVFGTLRVAFVGAAAGQLLTGAAELFRDRAPGCEVRLREAQPAELLRWLREDEADLGFGPFPVEAPDMVCGPPLVREGRALAVSTGHPLAGRRNVSTEDLDGLPVLHLSGLQHPDPQHPGGPEPAAATLYEALALVGAGQAVLPVGAHTRRYHPRPDITYLPLTDTPPLEWGLLWPADRATARIRAFTEAASDLLRDTTPDQR